MMQKQLNQAMSRPLKEIAHSLELQEAMRHNPDLQELGEVICRQASSIASGRIDPKLGADLAKQFISASELVHGIYDPIIEVIKDICKTHGNEKGRKLVIERGAKMMAEYYAALFDQTTQDKGSASNN